MAKNKGRTVYRKLCQDHGAGWRWMKLGHLPPLHWSLGVLGSQMAQSRKWQMSTKGPVFSLQVSFFLFFLFSFFLFFLSFVFLRPRLRHIEIPRLGVELEL